MHSNETFCFREAELKLMFFSTNMPLSCVMSCFVAQASCVCWGRFRQRLHSVVSNPFFDFVIALCLIANIIIMASEHYPMTYEFEKNFALSCLVSSVKKKAAHNEFC